MSAPSRVVLAAACVILVLLAVGTFLPLVHAGLVKLDDDEYVARNPMVLSGLTARGTAWAFTTFHAGYWIPLTWLSYMAEVQLFGFSTAVLHLTNILLHAAATALLFLFLQRATGRAGPAAAAAALFAIHPLHVESVAWVTERKDVLSTLLGFATLNAWVSYARRPAPWRHAAVAALFALGLMAKPMLVTLPLLLLVLDWWPLGRFGDGAGAFRQRFPRLALEKVPLLLVSAAASWLAFVSQKAGDLVIPLDYLPLGRRAINALLSYVWYLRKTLWPDGLAILYLRPAEDLTVAAGAAAALLLALITAGAVLAARRGVRYPLAGWLWYLGTLVPVIGLVQVGLQSMADRFSYVPLVGIFIAAAFGIADLGRRWRAPWIAWAAAIAVLVPLAAATRAQLAHWTDAVPAFSRAVEVDGRNWLARYNLGTSLLERGEFAAARTQLDTARRQNPGYPKTLANLGVAVAGLGDHEGALRIFSEFLARRPNDTDVRLSAARSMAELGRRDEAAAMVRDALAIEPGSAKVHGEAGILLLGLGVAGEGIAHLRTSLSIDPTKPEVRFNLATALAGDGNLSEAEGELRRITAMRPEFAPAWVNLGVLLGRTGRTGEARAALLTALRLDPGNAYAADNLKLLPAEGAAR